MTTQDHNRMLGIFQLIYGGLHVVGLLFLIPFLFIFMSNLPRPMPPELMPIMNIMLTFAVVLNLIFAIPTFVAGYALLKHKSWARMASIVAGVVEVMNLPLGTALGVYTFWFMFSDAGKQFYARPDAFSAPRYSLPEAAQPSTWWREEAASVRHEQEPIGRAQPPDWRGQ
jgi:hypothetical protein